MKDRTSIIIPARNEQDGLRTILPQLCAGNTYHEIIIVDDGSDDETRDVCADWPVTVISHKYSMGNGAAVKTGTRAASGEILLFMDADGQHDPADIDKLLAGIDEGYDLVVGARDRKSHAGLPRWIANQFYNTFASWISGHRVADLTSGFRAVRADKFRQFLFMLPNGFSNPTTTTMAFFRSGYAVSYIPVAVARRIGTSHIKPLMDGVRFLLIIFKVGTLYAPLKLFLPISLFFFTSGIGYYSYTYFLHGRFTNMGALLFITAIVIFLIGLVSEQLTVLLYSSTRNEQAEKRQPGDR